MSNKTALPFFLGASKSNVVQAFGPPTDSGLGERRGNYPDRGVTVAYNESDQVCRIWLRFADDQTFDSPTVLGVALGDSAKAHFSKFGDPLKTVTYSWAQFFVWQTNECWLKIETWLEDGDEEPWGTYKAGDVSEIEVSYDVPHVYVDDDSN